MSSPTYSGAISATSPCSESDFRPGRDRERLRSGRELHRDDDRANADVPRIQGKCSKSQDTLNSRWVVTNMPMGGDADAGVCVIGNQAFESGSGTQSFLQGPNRTQHATTNVAHQRTGIGLPDGTSLIDE